MSGWQAISTTTSSQPPTQLHPPTHRHSPARPPAPPTLPPTCTHPLTHLHAPARPPAPPTHHPTPPTRVVAPGSRVLQLQGEPPVGQPARRQLQRKPIAAGPVAAQAGPATQGRSVGDIKAPAELLLPPELTEAAATAAWVVALPAKAPPARPLRTRTPLPPRATSTSTLQGGQVRALARTDRLPPPGGLGGR